MKNRITVEFTTENWASELNRKGVLFTETGKSYTEIEEDIVIVRSYAYFGNTRVEMEVEKWVGSALSDCRKIEKIIAEEIIYVRGNGRFIEQGVPQKQNITLYESLK